MTSTTSKPATISDWKEWDNFLELLEYGTIWNHVIVPKENVSIFLGCDICSDQACPGDKTHLPQFDDPFVRLNNVRKGRAVPSSCGIVLKPEQMIH